MAVSNVAIYPQTIQTWAVQILPADTNTKKTLITSGTNGSFLEMLSVSNTDTNPYTVNIYINDGATDHLLSTINIPASSGNTTAAPAVDVLRSGQIPGLIYDTNGNQVLPLKAGYLLKVASTTTVTAAKILDFIAVGSDF